MSSVQSYIKQQNILYGAALVATDISLNFYNITNDSFTPVNVNLSNADAAGSQLSVFRDMGDARRSAGRIFRKVQLLSPSSPSTFGVVGSSTSASPANTYNTYWYENSIPYFGNSFTNALFRIQ
jgi:hypothetical protein